MNLGILFSGGKDSGYALYKASKENDIVVLITIDSKNKDSFMFHTPINNAQNLSNKLNIPLITLETEGEKEKELEDLKRAIKKAKEDFKIEGIATGAIASNYQASRIQKICDELDLSCLNPLWQKDQEELLRELVEKGFKIKIIKVAAEGLDESWIGKMLDNELIEKLLKLKERYGINIAGEGGEYESEVEEFPKDFLREFGKE
ncbi:MAG: diphthine--ammonia ligase [Nanoarchaeota archaeon]|nr:diphthine--ammonia ligase [Nanoarchaeota archaeon]